MKDRKQQSGGGAKGAVAAPPATTVEIALPIGALDGRAFVQRHIEVQLDSPQSEALRRVFNGLETRHARLASGKVVQHGADVVRYMLEQIAKNVGGAS